MNDAERAQIVDAFRANPAPFRGVTIDLIEQQHWFGLRIYQAEWDIMPEDKRQTLTAWLIETLPKLSAIAPTRLERL